MRVELPNFVTNNFLNEVFEKHFGNRKSLKIESFWGEWATKKGDNYASEMYRVHVNYEIEGIIFSKPVLLKVIVLIQIRELQ
jgi:Ecdysteroid kinase-like family